MLSLLVAAAGCGHDPEPEAAASETTTASRDIVLSPRQAEALQIALHRVTSEPLRFELPVPGIVLPAPGHEVILSAPIDGRISRLFVGEGSRVQVGDPLLEIESLTIGNLVADFIQARADASYLAQQLTRLEKLQDKGVGSVRELEKTRAEAQRSQASLNATRSRLVAIGFPQREVDGWDATETIDPRLTLKARIAGVVSMVDLALGQAVNTNEKLMVVVDPTHVLVRAFLAPQDLPMVPADGKVTIHSSEVDDEGLTSTIETINPTLDANNRAVTVNSLFGTLNGWPVPGQNLRVQVEAVTPGPVLQVPMSSLVFEGESAVVYVLSGDNRYEKRQVQVGRMTGKAVIIQSGLAVGDQVAMSSVFELKALGRLEQFGEE
jgi:RND family efflux transporter MFP subunit